MDKTHENIYITFGTNHADINGNSLFKNYVRLTHMTEGEARLEVWKVRGNLWSFLYTDNEDFERQIRMYGLSEVSLEDIALI